MAHPDTSKRRRIVFVLPALTAGGAERVLITLMNGLDSQRFEKHFVAVNEDGPLRSLIDGEIPFHALGRGTRVSRTLHKLLMKLRELKPDIVVSTMAHMNFGVLLLKPFLPRTRFIVREAITPSYFDQKSLPERTVIRAAWRILYPRAALVISPAQAIVDEFKGMGVPVKNHTVLPNPVDIEQIRGNGVLQRVPGVQFVCAGRLDPQKGFDRLIENLPKMPANANWSLTILGEGRQRPALEALVAANKLEERVNLAGYAASPWPKIAAADAFLMPSRFEGSPNAVLEALACGTPAIVTRESGGIAEIAAQAPPGSVTVVDNMDEFVAAMAKINPRPGEGQRPSLLPPSYDSQAVIRRFSELLDKACPSRA